MRFIYLNQPGERVNGTATLLQSCPDEIISVCLSVMIKNLDHLIRFGLFVCLRRMNLQRQKRRRRTSPTLNLRCFLWISLTTIPTRVALTARLSRQACAFSPWLAPEWIKLNQIPKELPPIPHLRPGERHSLTFTTAAVLAAPLGCGPVTDKVMSNAKKQKQKRKEKNGIFLLFVSFFFLLRSDLLQNFTKVHAPKHVKQQIAKRIEQYYYLLWTNISLYIICYRMLYWRLNQCFKTLKSISDIFWIIIVIQ